MTRDYNLYAIGVAWGNKNVFSTAPCVDTDSIGFDILDSQDRAVCECDLDLRLITFCYLDRLIYARCTPECAKF